MSLDRSRTPPPLEIASNDAAPGSGLGGPARYVARVRHCQVVGTDLTQELCDVATDLTHRVGLGDRVEIRQGDALALPFADGSFDVAWTQHVSMNIAGKAGMYAEMRRVVRAGGRLAFFDPLSGPEQPIRFPVPWAGDPASSALATVAETRDLVAAAGFEIRTWDDLTAHAVDFDVSLAAGPPPNKNLGLHLLIHDMPTKGADLKRTSRKVASPSSGASLPPSEPTRPQTNIVVPPPHTPDAPPPPPERPERYDCIITDG